MHTHTDTQTYTHTHALRTKQSQYRRRTETGCFKNQHYSTPGSCEWRSQGPRPRGSVSEDQSLPRDEKPGRRVAARTWPGAPACADTRASAAPLTSARPLLRALRLSHPGDLSPASRTSSLIQFQNVFFLCELVAHSLPHFVILNSEHLFNFLRLFKILIMSHHVAYH